MVRVLYLHRGSDPDKPDFLGFLFATTAEVASLTITAMILFAFIF